MREIYKANKFGAILNLFTSFGYFENNQDNYKMFDSVYQQLLPNGIFIVDFFNTYKVLNNLIKEETKVLNGIEFKIQKETQNGFLLKHIRFNAEGKNHHHTEKVQHLILDNFLKFAEHKFHLKNTFGDYQLNLFDKEKSNRLIMVFEKI